MFYEIEILDGKIVLFDAEGSSYDCRPFASYRDAKQIIREWARTYIMRVGESYRRLDEYFSRLVLATTRA